MSISHQSKVYDFDKVKKSTEMFLEAIGEDPKRDGLIETPTRVARYWEQVLNGYDEDPKRHLKMFDSDAKDMVVVEGPLYSFCEHHIALFHGKIYIAYIPNGKVIGISKLIRIARVFAKRLQIQERIASDLANFIEENISKDLAIHIKAEHTCMSIRGVRTPGSKTITTVLRGQFKEPRTQAEFLTYIK